MSEKEDTTHDHGWIWLARGVKGIWLARKNVSLEARVALYAGLFVLTIGHSFSLLLGTWIYSAAHTLPVFKYLESVGKTLLHCLDELGIALLVAYLLAVFVDQWLKKEMKDEFEQVLHKFISETQNQIEVIRKEVAPEFFLSDIEPAFRSEILRLRASSIRRYNFRLEIRAKRIFADESGDRRYIEIEVLMMSELRNQSHKAEEVTIRIAADCQRGVPVRPFVQRFRMISSGYYEDSCLIKNNKTDVFSAIGHVDWSHGVPLESASAEFIRDETNDVGDHWVHALASFPAKRESEEGHLAVSGSYQENLIWDGKAIGQFRSFYPVMGITVEFSRPPELENLEMNLIIDPRHNSTESIKPTTKDFWLLPSIALLPFQTLTFVFQEKAK